MRSTPFGVIAAIVVLLLSLPTAFASADEVKKVFDSLFAAKIKAVGATIDRGDDIALGKEMLAIAKTSEEQPELLVLLCDQVHDLCIKHADGFAIAVEAQQLLAEKVETKRAGAQEKLTTLLTRQMTAGKADEREGAGESLVALLLSMGDEKFEKKQYAEAAGDYRRAVTVATQRKASSLEEAKSKLEFAAARDRAVKNLARLQEKLLKDANDFATAEEIVKLYVVELDDPAGARAYADRIKNVSWREAIPLATKEIDTLTVNEALNLGDLYVMLGKSSTSMARTIVLHKAKACYERFLSLHESKDLTRTRVEVTLKEVETLIAQSGPPIRSAPRRKNEGNKNEGNKNEGNLLEMIDETKDVFAGKASRSRSDLILDGTDGPTHVRVAIPYKITGKYEVNLHFTRLDGKRGPVMVLPVGGRQIFYGLEGWDGDLTAFHVGLDNNLATIKGIRTTLGKKHVLRLEVTPTDKQATLKSWLDGKPLLDWTGPISAIDAPNTEKPKRMDQCMLGTYGSRIQIHECKIRIIEGSGTEVDH